MQVPTQESWSRRRTRKGIHAFLLLATILLLLLFSPPTAQGTCHVETFVEWKQDWKRADDPAEALILITTVPIPYSMQLSMNLFGTCPTSHAQVEFIHRNHAQILEDAARGRGRHLEALATLLNIQPEQHEAFLSKLRTKD